MFQVSSHIRQECELLFKVASFKLTYAVGCLLNLNLGLVLLKYLLDRFATERLKVQSTLPTVLGGKDYSRKQEKVCSSYFALSICQFLGFA